MTMANLTISEDPMPAVENLYPALIQCFAIILCGYFAGRMNWVSETESKGMNMFVGTFSLPSLIFISLARLDLSAVNWMFLLSILISKSVVFITVIIVTLLVMRPLNFARAGLFAIFCTQSNDFAIGYPLVEALYKHTHPDYGSYLYLMAPINLVILNPIAFVLMEIGSLQRQESLLSYEDISDSFQAHKKRFKLVLSVTKSIVFNPIVFMTFMGILGNVIFKQHVPEYIGGILDVLGKAFSASALFLLGIRMVGKVHTLRGATLVVPGILIMVKLIALPLVATQVISLLNPGVNCSDSQDLSTYGFLYGTFPSAPGVFVFATQYSLDIDLIASAMVACTFLSAPLMFVSAKMVTIAKADPSDYIKQLDNFIFDVSIAGIIGCAWVMLVFVVTKKINKIPHKITACLVISQFLSCFGAVLWNTLDKKEGWLGNLQFTIFVVGVYSTRLWTSILAVTLVFLQCRSLCFVLKLQPVFVIIGWGLPILLAVLMLVLGGKISSPFNKTNPNFVYGQAEAITSVSLLVLCFIVTAGCLILHQRYRRRLSNYVSAVRDVSDGAAPPADNIAINTANNAISEGSSGLGNSGLPTINEGLTEESPVVDIEDLLLGNDRNNISSRQLCPSGFGCKVSERVQCEGIIQQYRRQIDEDMEYIEEEPEAHEPQFLRHVVLLILLLCSMFVGLGLTVWTLLMKQMSGIYVELSFVDATLNFGQSLIVFVIFGLNTKEIAVPCLVNYWRKLWYGAHTLILPTWHELTPETKHICDQFLTHHLQNCKAAIAADKRWRIKVYKDVFTGEKFVGWLIEVGLARDRGEAVNYARHLVEGKILKHINSVFHFYDRNLLYTFA